VSKPILTETAERFYNQLAPTFFREDERYEWAGAKFCAAFAKLYDPAAEVVQVNGSKPGFAILADPVNCPQQWLPWLGQFVGIPPEVGLAMLNAGQVSTLRAWIKSPIGYTRGKPSAMRLTAEVTLTGTKTLYFYVKYGGAAFEIRAASLISETPNPTATKEAIESMMAAWEVLHYEAVTAGTMAILEASHATMALIEAAHGTMENLELHPEL
jgi:hypothetical protein